MGPGVIDLRSADEPDFDLAVVCRGEPVGERTIAYARRKVANAARAAPGRVLFARLKLGLEPHRSVERPASAEVMVDVDGQPVRARVTARDVREAIDLVEERLRRQLTDAEHRNAFLRRRHSGVAAQGQWRHGNLPTLRPPYFPRPREERQIVRHKTFALGRLTAEEAAAQMDMLDHDFYLFVDSGTGRDALIRRQPDGTYMLVRTAPCDEEPGWLVPIRVAPGPPTELTLDAAVQRLDACDERFVFFVDPATGRGTVLYRRYDGHYGVVTAAPREPDEGG